MSEAKNTLFVYGAGKFGKVVFETLVAAGTQPAGFLDDNQQIWGTVWRGAKVLGGTEYLRNLLAGSADEARIVVAIGNNTARISISENVRALGAKLVNAVHPSAVLMPSAQLGSGCIICAGSVIQSSVRVGDYSIVNTRAGIDHDSVLGEGAWIAPGVCTGGGVAVGKAAYISTGAILCAGVSVGEGSVVGAGCVISRDMPPRTLAINLQPKFFPLDDTFDFDRLIRGVSRPSEPR